MKTTIPLLISLLIMIFFLLPSVACAPPEEPVEIATYSLDQVIDIAIERSPECRLQIPGVKTKG